MKKIFTLMILVYALAAINVAAVSAEELSSSIGSRVVPLIHGVDH